MEKNFYDILEISSRASQVEVRKAFRILVLKLHPDRNPSPKATELFMLVTKAYETLSHPEKRANYDKILNLNIQISEAKKRVEVPKQSHPRNPPKKPIKYERIKTEETRKHEPIDWTKTKTKTKGYGTSETEQDYSKPKVNQNRTDPRSKLTPTNELLRLTSLVARARYAEAERLAKKITEKSPDQPLPFAILGDIYRMRGQYRDALVMYSYAIQADPVNMMYQRKHDEVLKNLSSTSNLKVVSATEQMSPSSAAALAGLVTLSGLVYVVLSKEPAEYTWQIINTWTTGLISMMAIAGIAIGASMALAGWLDRIVNQYQAAVVSISPGLALSFLGAINFWIACGVYIFIGAMENVFNLSSSRLLAVVAGVTILFASAGAVNGEIDFVQVALWGGNVIYLGAVLGWAAADGIREPG